MSVDGAFYAYLHCKPDGTPFYVGKGKLQRARYLGDRNPWHRNTVEKYGRAKIKVVLIACATEQLAFMVEKELIRVYRQLGVPLCNFTAGGEGGSDPCEETRARLSAAAKRRGISQATRDAVSKAKKGVPLSDEQKKKQSVSMRESWRCREITTEHHVNLSAAARKRGVSIATREAGRNAARMTGRHHSEETKAKMRTVAKGREIPQHVRDAARLANLGKKRPHSEPAKERMRAVYAERRTALISAGLLQERPQNLGWTSEKRERMSKIKKANPTRYWLGRPRSSETIEKIRATKLAQAAARRMECDCGI